MRRILKYKVSGCRKTTLQVPYGANFLSAQIQDGNLVIWADVNDANELIDTHVWPIMTGEDIQAFPGEYIDAVQYNNRGFVVHVYAYQDTGKEAAKTYLDNHPDLIPKGGQA